MLFLTQPFWMPLNAPLFVPSAQWFPATEWSLICARCPVMEPHCPFRTSSPRLYILWLNVCVPEEQIQLISSSPWTAHLLSSCSMVEVHEKPLQMLGCSLWLVAAQRLHRKVAAVPEHQFLQWIRSGFLCTKVEVCCKHSSLAPVRSLAMRKSAFPEQCCLRMREGRNQACKRQPR